MNDAGPRPHRALGDAAARGMFYSGVAQGLKIVITIATVVLVSRILLPSDYGIIAMTSPITGFILIFQNLGLNQALVQVRDLRDEQVNALFLYNIAASAAVALVMLCISPLVVLFYADARPGYVAAASALTVLVTGTTLQHTAFLNRHMRFRALALIDVAVATTTLVATLAFALLLRSYWALWLGTFVATLANAMLVWMLGPWRPNRRVVLGSATGLVRFGANLVGFNMLNFLNRNVDNVLIAKVWGAVSLGLYDRSYRLMMFSLQNVNTPLSRVILPILARLRDQPERYRRVVFAAIT